MFLKNIHYSYQNVGCLNDLWKFSVSDSTWTWIHGNNTLNKKGIYGTQGYSNPTNIPGARYGAVGWFDSSAQELWMLGGNGYDSSTNFYGTHYIRH